VSLELGHRVVSSSLLPFFIIQTALNEHSILAMKKLKLKHLLAQFNPHHLFTQERIHAPCPMLPSCGTQGTGHYHGQARVPLPQHGKDDIEADNYLPLKNPKTVGRVKQNLICY
jgi:hypothetical protein